MPTTDHSRGLSSRRMLATTLDSCRQAFSDFTGPVRQKQGVSGSALRDDVQFDTSKRDSSDKRVRWSLDSEETDNLGSSRRQGSLRAMRSGGSVKDKRVKWASVDEHVKLAKAGCSRTGSAEDTQGSFKQVRWSPVATVFL